MWFKLYLSLAVIVLTNIGCVSWLRHFILIQQSQSTTEAVTQGFSPDVFSTWPTNRLSPIAMPIENTLRYQLNATGDAEWEALLPNDGIIYLGLQRKPYAISMFHQLRCLDMLRRRIMRLNWPQSHSNRTLAPENQRDLTQHCVGYLRQMIVCRADTALEGLAGEYGATREGLARCKDWRQVYDALYRSNMES